MDISRFGIRLASPMRKYISNYDDRVALEECIRN